MCLNLLQHALYFLWMDFHPCLYIYIHGFLTIKDKKEHFVRDFVCVCVCFHWNMVRNSIDKLLKIAQVRAQWERTQ